jgi:hypothetical protein
MIRIRFINPLPDLFRFKKLGRLRQLRFFFVIIFWIKGKWPPREVK